MSNTIQIKRNSTANVTPTAGQLASGELAINTADGRLFAKNAAGTVVNLPVTSISGQAITPSSVGATGDVSGSTLTSTVATGTAPLSVTSTTAVTNLNADTVDGQHASAFAAAPSFTSINASTGTLTAARDAFYKYTVVGAATITLPTANQQTGDIVCILVGIYASGSLTVAGAVTGTDVLSAAGQKVTYQYVSGQGGGWFKLPVDSLSGQTITPDKVTAASGSGFGTSADPANFGIAGACRLLTRGDAFIGNSAGTAGVHVGVVAANTWDNGDASVYLEGVNEAVTQYKPIILTSGYFPQLALSTDGKVGVNTANPQANFQVITGYDLTGYDNSDPPLPIYAKTTSGLSGAQQSEVLQVIHGGYDYDNGAEEYFTNEYVNLARFHVNGAASRGSFSLSNSGSGAWENNVMQLFVHGANYPHGYYGSNTSDAGCAMIVTQGSEIQKLQIGNYGAAPIEFFTSNTFRAVISTAGDVGIGTPTPGYKLDVVGDLNVSGAVRVNGQTILGNPISKSNYVTIGALFTDQTITANVDTLISFTVASDPQNWWNPTTKRFQPTVAGNYNVTLQGWWNPGAVTNNQTNLQCRKNGNTVMIAQDPINNVTGQTQTLSRIIYLDGATDYLDFTAYTGNTTSQSLLSGGATGQGTFFSASLIADGGLRLPGEMLYLWSNFR